MQIVDIVEPSDPAPVSPYVPIVGQERSERRCSSAAGMGAPRTNADETINGALNETRSSPQIRKIMRDESFVVSRSGG